MQALSHIGVFQSTPRGIVAGESGLTPAGRCKPLPGQVHSAFTLDPAAVTAVAATVQRRS